MCFTAHLLFNLYNAGFSLSVYNRLNFFFSRLIAQTGVLSLQMSMNFPNHIVYQLSTIVCFSLNDIVTSKLQKTIGTKIPDF